MTMKCFYINLDRAASRRELIERAFAQFNSKGISLERFKAFDTQYVTESNILGSITDVEKACFLSHRQIIKNNANEGNHVWILEDDQTFSSQTMNILNNFFAHKSAELDWDILYTDVGAPSIAVMADLMMMRRTLMNSKSIECLNLRTIPFFGATSYIINAKSITKIAELIEGSELTIQFDLLLRKLIYEGKLNAFVTFPFLTTDSDEASISSIQKSETAQTDLIWSLFRRLTWLDGDGFDPTPLLNEIWKGLDKRSQLYGVLWAAMADPSFKSK